MMRKIFVLCIITYLIFLVGCDVAAVPSTEELYEAEVISVQRYAYINTNQFGKGESEVKYYFIFINKEGDLIEVKDYEIDSYHSLKVGKENKLLYNPDNWFDDRTTLYLTKETFENL